MLLLMLFWMVIVDPEQVDSSSRLCVLTTLESTNGNIVVAHKLMGGGQTISKYQPSEPVCDSDDPQNFFLFTLVCSVLGFPMVVYTRT